jgi:hypothetical protein
LRTPRRSPRRGVLAFKRLDDRSAAKQTLDVVAIRSYLAKKIVGPNEAEKPHKRMPVMWVLLLLPFVGLLWVPFYNFQEPALFGFPFFYWYQLAWVPITSLLIWVVYRSQKPDDETP